MAGKKQIKFDEAASRSFRLLSRDLERFPAPKRDPERELFLAVARGDRDARSRAIASNMRLVIRLAKKYVGYGLPLEDLVPEGCLGLIRAVDLFDVRLGYKFSGFAGPWICQAIRQGLTERSRVVRIPNHAVSLMSRWLAVERRLASELQRQPSFDEVCDRFGLSEQRREIVRAALTSDRHSQADEVFDPEEVADDRDDFETLAHAEIRAQVSAMLDQLDQRGRQIIEFHFGLGGLDPMPSRDIATRLGVDRKSITWKKRATLRKLQALA